MKLGIVGLPNVGKSTLFNAITNAGAESANYPFCTIEPNVGMVTVPDERMDFLAEMYNPKKFTPAVIEFVDIAGLVKGASKGEGLGNKFLDNIRATDAIVHVVRCFDDENVIHVDGSTDPRRDIETIDLELIMSDAEMVTRRIDRLSKVAKSGNKGAMHEMEVFKELLEHLNDGKSARSFECDAEDMAIVRMADLLTLKPIIYAANMDEDGVAAYESNAYYQTVCEIAAGEDAQVLPICARIEEELVELGDEGAKEYLEELGVEDSGIDKMIKSVYKLLNLITFITAGEKEVHAWTCSANTKAPQAAGVIHTDFEKGFIRAEVTSYKDFVECGSYTACKEKGVTRLEGKEYIVQDGDILEFLFNV